TRFTFGAQREALIQLLSDLHCAFGGEPQVPGGLLLERARDEGGGRPAGLRVGLDGKHPVASRLEQCNEPLGLCFVGDLELLLLAREALEAGAERRRNLGLLELGVDCPEFLPRERLDLTLALDDETDGDGLHPAGRETTPDFRPEEWAQPVADEAVENAPGLLRVHELHVDVARWFVRLLHCFRGARVDY